MTAAVLEVPEQLPPQALAPVNVQPDVLQLSLPITVVLVGTAAGAVRMLHKHRYRRPACCARAGQLEINWAEPARHPPRVKARQVSRCRPRRQRPVRPYAAADVLALGLALLALWLLGVRRWGVLPVLALLALLGAVGVNGPAFLAGL